MTILDAPIIHPPSQLLSFGSGFFWWVKEYSSHTKVKGRKSTQIKWRLTPLTELFFQLRSVTHGSVFDTITTELTGLLPCFLFLLLGCSSRTSSLYFRLWCLLCMLIVSDFRLCYVGFFWHIYNPAMNCDWTVYNIWYVYNPPIHLL